MAGTPRTPRTPLHVCMLNIEDPGHLGRMLDLAHTLAHLESRPVAVTFVGPPTVRNQVVRTGATHINYMDDPTWDLFKCSIAATRDVLKCEPSPTQSHSMPLAVLPATVALLPWLVEKLARQPSELASPAPVALIVFDAAVPWGRALAAKLGVPGLCLMTALPGVPAHHVGGDAQAAAVRHLAQHFGVHMSVDEAYHNYVDHNAFFVSRSWLGEEQSAAYAPEKFLFLGPRTSTMRLSFLHASAATDAFVGSVEARLCSWQAEKGSAAAPKLVFAAMGTIVTGPAYKPYGRMYHEFVKAAFAALGDCAEYVVVLSVGQAVRIADDGKTLLFPAADDFADGATLTVPANFVVEPRVPQLAVLSMPSCRVFVSHCGMNSVAESLSVSMPIVAFPFFGDQPHNARRVQDFGFGLNLDSFDRKAPGALQESRVPLYDQVSAVRLRDAVDRVCAGTRAENPFHAALAAGNDAFVRGDVAPSSGGAGAASMADSAAQLLTWIGV